MSGIDSTNDNSPLRSGFPQISHNSLLKSAQLEVRPQAPGLNRFDQLRRGGGQKAVSLISTLSVRFDI